MFAKKSLGQNFLNSQRVVKRIADAGDIKKGEIILEIGPGKGVLTEALLRRGANVLAVEKDDRLIPILKEKFSKEIKSGQLELVHEDITSPNTIENLKLKKDFKLIANIPYYITGEIMRLFLSALIKPKTIVLMVQKEVVDRIIARDGKESILSVSVKIYGKPSLVMNVSRGNFFPIPNVDSAVIKIENIISPFKNLDEEKRFFDILHAGFAHKRKKLSSNLKNIVSKEKFQELKLEENVRAEDIGVEKWIELAKN